MPVKTTEMMAVQEVTTRDEPVIRRLAAALNWWQAWLSTGLLQGVVRQLRQQAEDKIARLPLSWFDRQPHGEVLSRVTNDLDNISQSLQQLLSQLLMSALSLIGVLFMMLLLSPALTLIALLAVAASSALAAVLTALAQPHFSEQWRCTGVLNATVEEDCSGHTLIKVFNHQAAARAQFDRDNESLYRSSYVAQALSGAVQPGILFIGNLVFTGIALFGGLRVIAGSLSLGLLQAFVQYSRQLTQPMSQIAGMTGSTQSGLASTERVFELLDAAELPADAPAVDGVGTAAPQDGLWPRHGRALGRVRVRLRRQRLHPGLPVRTARCSPAGPAPHADR